MNARRPSRHAMNLCPNVSSEVEPATREIEPAAFDHVAISAADDDAGDAERREGERASAHVADDPLTTRARRVCQHAPMRATAMTIDRAAAAGRRRPRRSSPRRPGGTTRVGVS